MQFMGVNHPLYFELKEPRCQALRSDCEPKWCGFFCKSQRMDAVTAAPSHGWMALVPRLQLTGVWSRGCMAELKSQDGLMTHGGGIFSSSISVDRFVHPSFFCSSHLVLSWSTYRRPRYESFLIKIHQNPMNLYEASVPTISSKHFQ